MNDKIVHLFEKIRDLPYSIPLSTIEKDLCCNGKARLLKELLEKEGLQVRYRVCEFRWSDFEKLPPHIVSLPHGNDSTHVYLEVLIDGNWVKVDPTWDRALGCYFDISDWDGQQDTKIAVMELAPYSIEKSRQIMEHESEEDIKRDIEMNGLFYKALNDWLSEIRIDGKSSAVGECEDYVK